MTTTRLISETINYGAFSLAHQYTYDGNNQVATYTGPDGVTISYTYDLAGQLESLSIPGEGTISVQEWMWIKQKRTLFPGGTSAERKHDGYLELTGLTVRSSTQQTTLDLTASYGKLFDLSERTIDGTKTSYLLDDAVRLIGVAEGANNTSYALDPATNRVSQTGVAGIWTYDAANQLLNAGGRSYSYDEVGNLIRKVDTSRAEPGRTTTYVYDALNRLSEVRDGTNTVIARYAYDPFNRRFRKEAANGATFYLHGARGLLAEANSAGAVTMSYGWHPGMIVQLCAALCPRHFHYGRAKLCVLPQRPSRHATAGDRQNWCGCMERTI